MGWHGGSGLALLPHSKKVLGLILSLCGICMFFPCLFGFPPPSTNEYVRCISCQYPWTSYWLSIWSWSLGTALWLPIAPQGWVKCKNWILLYACCCYLDPISHLTRQSVSSVWECIWHGQSPAVGYGVYMWKQGPDQYGVLGANADTDIREQESSYIWYLDWYDK